MRVPGSMPNIILFDCCKQVLFLPTTVKLNKNIKIFVNYFLGPILFIWLAWSIYKQISAQEDIGTALQHIKNAFTGPEIAYLIAAILLMPVNLGLESYKWMLAVRRVQDISLGKAFKAVFSGVAFSISTPNSLGDYVGRVLYMDDGKRIKAISLTIVANISQLIVTILMGALALFFLKNTLTKSDLLSTIFVNTVLSSSVLALIILLLFYFRLPWLVRIIDNLPQFKKFSWITEAVEHVDATLLVRFLSLSIGRFVIFSLQYFLLFKLYGVEINVFECWMSISVMFLVMTAIPTIALFTDVGLKNELSIRLVGLFSSNHLGISFTSLSVWLINLVIPALIGSILILGIKNILKDRNKHE